MSAALASVISPIGGNSTSVTLSVTVGAGSDRFGLATTHLRGPDDFSDLTLDGVSIASNLVGSVLAGLANSNGRRVMLHGKVAPTVGTYDAVLTTVVAAQQILSFATFTGVHQTTPTGVVDSKTGVAVTSLQADPQSAVGDVVWSATSSAIVGDSAVPDGTLTPAYTAYNTGTSALEAAAAYRAGAAGTTPMPWTWGSPAAGIGQALIGVRIRDAAATLFQAAWARGSNVVLGASR